MIPQIHASSIFSYPKSLDEFIQTHLHLNNTSPDFLIISASKTTIGIDQVRYIQNFLSTSPKIDTFKTIVIVEAHKLTLPAQNAFLKTLEEPPSYATIHLLTNNHHGLLATIRSRCQLNIHSTQIATVTTPPFPLPQNISESITLSDKLSKDKDKLNHHLQELIIYYRQQLLSQPHQKYLFNLTLTLYSQKLLAQNTNPKLVLDNLFFYLKSESATNLPD